jgi:hypothetical protein
MPTAKSHRTRRPRIPSDLRIQTFKHHLPRAGEDPPDPGQGPAYTPRLAPLSNPLFTNKRVS